MKPNKLNIHEMWKLYLLLEPSLPEKFENEIEDEIVSIVIASTPETLLECVHILYDNKMEVDSAEEFLLCISKGLMQNMFFVFVEFARGLHAH